MKSATTRGRWPAYLSVTLLSIAVLMSGCGTEEEQLRQELAEAAGREAILREELEALRAEIGPLRAEHEAAEAARAEEEAEQAAAEAAQEEVWGSIRGRYRCSGGLATGLTIRNGYAQIAMGGYEQLTGNVSYRARIRGNKLYITDPQRGAVGWRIRDGGRVLVPDSQMIARRCVKR